MTWWNKRPGHQQALYQTSLHRIFYYLYEKGLGWFWVSLTHCPLCNHFKSVNFEDILCIKFMSNSYGIGLRWIPQNTFNDKSTLVQQQAITWTNADPDLCGHMALWVKNNFRETTLMWIQGKACYKFPKCLRLIKYCQMIWLWSPFWSWIAYCFLNMSTLVPLNCNWNPS